MWMQINQAWSGLALREKRLLGVLFVVLLLAGIYGLIWSPIQTQNQQAQASLKSAQTDWLWLNEQAPKVVAQGGQAETIQLTSKTELMDTIQQSLRTQNLLRSMQSINLTNQGVKVAFAEVDAPRLFRWLAELELQGLMASRIELTPIQAGLTQAELQFEVAK